MSVKSTVDDTVQLADAPDIPGLRFRRYRGESDLEGMVAVFEASSEVDKFDWLMTVEDLRVDFAHPHVQRDGDGRDRPGGGHRESQRRAPSVRGRGIPGRQTPHDVSKGDGIASEIADSPNL